MTTELATTPEATAHSVISLNDLTALTNRLQFAFVDLEPLTGTPGGVYVRELTAIEQQELAKRAGKIVQRKDGATEIDTRNMDSRADARLFVECTFSAPNVDARLFDYKRKNDKDYQSYVNTVTKLPSSVVSTVVAKIRELSGLNEDSGNTDPN